MYLEISLFLSSDSFYFLLVFAENQLLIWLILFFVSLIFTHIYIMFLHIRIYTIIKIKLCIVNVSYFLCSILWIYFVAFKKIPGGLSN